jgi:hypothetical protein
LALRDKSKQVQYNTRRIAYRRHKLHDRIAHSGQAGISAVYVKVIYRPLKRAENHNRNIRIHGRVRMANKSVLQPGPQQENGREEPMPPEPEREARKSIDALLIASGWAVQNYAAFHPSAARGSRLHEIPLLEGCRDYLLIMARAAVGIVEAKLQ